MIISKTVKKSLLKFNFCPRSIPPGVDINFHNSLNLHPSAFSVQVSARHIMKGDTTGSWPEWNGGKELVPSRGVCEKVVLVNYIPCWLAERQLQLLVQRALYLWTLIIIVVVGKEEVLFTKCITFNLLIIYSTTHLSLISYSSTHTLPGMTKLLSTLSSTREMFATSSLLHLRIIMHYLSSDEHYN